MVKKVLSVVLAIVLTLGICTIAASAATSTQLSTLLAKLPNEYNDYFYNDETYAAITAAKAAANAALNGGTQEEIDEAYALCQTAHDLVTDESEFWWIDPLIPDEGQWVPYYTNRDENKAIADYKWRTDAGKYVKQGDTITITISLKTNFYVASMYTAFAYDRTKFEHVETVCTEGLLTYLEVVGINPNRGKKPTGEVKDGAYPTAWSEEKVDQYNIYCVPFSIPITAPSIFLPTEELDIMEITFKVLDDATDGDGAFFMPTDFLDPFIPLDPYYEDPCIRFTRASGPNYGKGYLDYRPIDDQARYGKTVNLPEDLVFTIGEAELADYSALDTAIATLADYDSADYTAESWAAFAEAVAAGEALSRDLTIDDQDKIDACTAAIVAARGALVLAQSDDCRILSINATTPVKYQEKATLEILVEGNPSKLRFLDPSGNTITYGREQQHNTYIGIVDNGDGTETWTLELKAYAASTAYAVYAKYPTEGWVEPPYNYTLAVNADSTELDVYSYEISDSYDGVMYAGVHEVTVVTGADVAKVQFFKDGNTWTYASNNATVTTNDQGQKVWTMNMNFSQLGESLDYTIRVRSNATVFESSGVVMNVAVRSK